MTNPPPTRSRLRWPRASLGAYLVAIMLMATVPLAVLTSLQILEGIHAQRAQLESTLQRSATALAGSVEREITASIEVLNMLSFSESLEGGDIEQFRRILGTSPRLRANWSGAFLLDADGRVVIESHKTATSVLPAAATFRQWIPVTLAQGRPVVSDLIVDGATDKTFTVVLVPVMSGRERYVLGTAIESGVWQSVVEVGAAPDGGFAALFDGLHRIVARSRLPKRFVGSTLPSESIAAIQHRDSGFQRLPNLEGGAVYVAWTKVPTGDWSVGVSMPAEPIEQGWAVSVLKTLGTSAACLLLGVWFALFVARVFTRPLTDLAHRGATETAAPEPVAEIEALRAAMLQSDRQRDASHGDLRRKAIEFETLFDSSPVALAFAHDSECKSVLQNSAMNELLPWPPVGVRLRYRDRPLAIQQLPLCRAAAHGEVVGPMEIEIQRPGSPTRFVLASAVPIRGSARAPHDARWAASEHGAFGAFGAIGAMVDISERKTAESLLVAADQRLLDTQNLVDLAQEAGGVGFFRFQWAGQLLSWSPGQARLFDAPTDDDVDGEAMWRERVDPADRERAERAMDKLLAARERAGTFDYRIQLTNGGSRWLSSRVIVEYADAGCPVQLIGITVDNSDRQAIDRQRIAMMKQEQAARVKAEAENRAKDEFLAMLGHELRNPLAAISSATEVLDRVERASSLADNARVIIARQTRNLARMMDDLLDVGRVLSGKVHLAPHGANLAELVRQALAAAELTGQLREHPLERELQDVWVRADSTRIEQVVANLVGNAAQYTRSGGCIRVEVRAQDGEAVLVVQDEGPGIPAELQPRVFDLFVQGARPLDRRTGGLGVGLTMVKRLVELHGGRVELDSSPQGSRFTVRLPALQAQPDDSGPSPLSQARQQRVVVVDDNADALVALRSLLELDGHSVHTAADGPSGLALLLQDRPDVAIVDIGLPGLSGYEVATRARAHGYNGNLVALTGYGQGRDARASLAAGFDAHLTKPIDLRRLREIMVAN